MRPANAATRLATLRPDDRNHPSTPLARLAFGSEGYKERLANDARASSRYAAQARRKEKAMQSVSNML